MGMTDTFFIIVKPLSETDCDMNKIMIQVSLVGFAEMIKHGKLQPEHVMAQYAFSEMTEAEEYTKGVMQAFVEEIESAREKFRQDVQQLRDAAPPVLTNSTLTSILLQEFLLDGMVGEAAKILKVVSRTGRTAEGGEQFGNSMHCDAVANRLNSLLKLR